MRIRKQILLGVVSRHSTRRYRLFSLCILYSSRPVGKTATGTERSFLWCRCFGCLSCFSPFLLCGHIFCCFLRNKCIFKQVNWQKRENDVFYKRKNFWPFWCPLCRWLRQVLWLSGTCFGEKFRLFFICKSCGIGEFEHFGHTIFDKNPL